MSIIILEAQGPSSVRKMVLHYRSVLRIMFVSNNIVKDADRLLNVEEQNATGFWSPVMYLFMYLHSPVFHFPQCLPCPPFPLRC